LKAKPTWKFRSLSGNAAVVMATSPTVTAAAKRLGVDRVTVHRWIKAGRIAAPSGRKRGPAPSGDVPTSLELPQSPEEWARWARETFVLTGTELALVALAELALTIAWDKTQKSEVRLSAAGRYQRLVQQLDFEEESEDGQAETTDSRHRPWPRRVG
jgi:hypothetical protein